MDRTLYLSEKKGLEVMRDGPSVWIKEEGKAGQRIPARLIGKVVILGNVKIDSASITLFASRNIPVTFSSRKGAEVALTVPYNHDLDSHREEQGIFLETRENVERFRTWTKAQRRRLQLDTIQRIAPVVASVFTSCGFRERDYGAFITRTIPIGHKPRMAVEELLHTLYCETILKKLIDAGLDAHGGIINRRSNFGFVFDICHILAPSIDLELWRFFRDNRGNDCILHNGKGWYVTKEGIREIVHRFESGRETTEDVIDRILDGFFRLMRELRHVF